MTDDSEDYNFTDFDNYDIDPEIFFYFEDHVIFRRNKQILDSCDCGMWCKKKKRTNKKKRSRENETSFNNV